MLHIQLDKDPNGGCLSVYPLKRAGNFLTAIVDDFYTEKTGETPQKVNHPAFHYFEPNKCEIMIDMIEFWGYEPKELIICGANTPDVIKYLTDSGMVDLGGTGDNIYCNFTHKNMPKYETLKNGWFFRSELDYPHYEDWATEQFSIISTYDIFMDCTNESELLYPAIDKSEILNILPLFDLNKLITTKSLELHQMAYDQMDFNSFVY